MKGSQLFACGLQKVGASGDNANRTDWVFRATRPPSGNGGLAPNYESIAVDRESKSSRAAERSHFVIGTS